MKRPKNNDSSNQLTERKFMELSETTQINIIRSYIQDLEISTMDLNEVFNDLVKGNQQNKNINMPFLTIANIISNYIDKERKLILKYVRAYQMAQNLKK